MNEVVGRYATEMERLATERAQQLVHAERMSGLGIMAADICESPLQCRRRGQRLKRENRTDFNALFG